MEWKRSFVIALVVVLAGSYSVLLTAQDLDPNKREAVADLAGLHAAAAAYLADKGHWPQMPNGLLEGSETDFFQFWKDALKPYGASQEMWVHSADVDQKTGSYVPTAFDDGRYTPYRWEQPWFMARADFGGSGSLLVMPSGAVVSAREAMEKGAKANLSEKAKTKGE